MVADLADLFDNDPPGLLAQEKSGYKDHIGIPGKTEVGSESKGDHNEYGNMDGKDPLERELFYVCTPVPEGNIHQEYDQPDQQQFGHVTNLVNKPAGCFQIDHEMRIGVASSPQAPPFYIAKSLRLRVHRVIRTASQRF